MPPATPSRRDLSKSIARLEKQVATAEKDIAQLEEQIKARDIELAAPATYQDYSRWNVLHQEREKWTTTSIASHTNGATSAPTSKNNNPKSRNW